MDLILQIFIIIAGVGTLLSALKASLPIPTSWLIRGALIGYVTVGTLLIRSRIGTDQPLIIIGAAFVLFLLIVLAGANRRGHATEAFASAAMVVCTIGVVWAMRLLAAENITIRTFLIMGAAAVIVAAAAVGPNLLPLLGRVPSVALAVAGIGLVALPAVTLNRVNGALINVTLPVIGDVQPGELGRLLLLLWLARSVAYWRPSLVVDVAATNRERLALAINLTLPILIGVAVGFLSNDLGPALVLILASAAVIFVGGLGWRWVTWTGFLSIAAIVLLVSASSKVAARLATVSDPLSVASGGLGQIGMGLVALAHAPMGLGNGVVTVIPNWHNDMILAAIGHELGMSHLVVILSAVLVMAITTPGLMTRTVNDRNKLAILGLVAALTTQTLLMLGAILAVAPLTGMPVPFLSMSGSAVLATALAFGLIIASDDGTKTPISPALTRRTLAWSLITIAVTVALIGRVGYLQMTAKDTLSQTRAHDRIATRLVQAATGTVLTADGYPITKQSSKDGKPLRLANLEVTLGHDMYTSVMRPSDQPGLEAAIGGSNDCLLDNCPTTTTTLVHSVQTKAWEGMQGKTGAVVAVDLQTGNVLAYISTTDGQPGTDRVRHNTIAPGSTAKPLTAAAATTKNLNLNRSAKTTHNYDGGTITSMSGKPCGKNLNSAMATSCNPYFAALGDELGTQQLSDLTSTWLNHQSTIEGMPITPSTLVRPDDPSGFAALGAIGLGNAQVTPIGLLSATATIARNGHPLCMRLLEDGEADSATESTMDETAAALSAHAMRAVVTDGTARNVPGIHNHETAAKTGTADYDPTYTNATFTAFAPATNPTVAVTVFLEPGPQQTTKLVGGQDAGPIAIEVLNAALER